jgi:HEAT repeat protein
VESAAAMDLLIEHFTSPLAEAIGPMSPRPVEEQLRLRGLLSRLTGALRMRIFRLDLPPAERALYDSFAESYPQLCERLFDGNWRVRRAAVQQIPLEPDTGAGVLIAAKVDDEDEMVATAALKAAARLRDPVVIRNLTRFIQDATDAVRSGIYGPEDQDIALTLALFVHSSLGIVTSSPTAENIPVVIGAIQYFLRSQYWDPQRHAAAFHMLGRLNDRRAAPILLDRLDDPSLMRWQTGTNKERLRETLGDVALLNLARVFDLKPETFGLHTLPDRGDFAGYPDEKSRQEGHRAFRIWLEEHAEKETDEHE